ncbi:MAG TPA: IPT/TIG domain-containing protein, partial [Anaeromyxobacteraceae bacterium]|nr:IPT/TIG domain-containing protein [Anaeromyxobacteraceae bacterium]
KRGHDDRRPESREERALQARAEVETSADAGALAAEAPYHVSPERARAIDLEWNQELPQPPQDQVVAPPPAWRPAAQAEVAAAPEISDVWPNKGPEAGGDVVLIKGKNLGASQVLFGMAPARIIEASADAVKVAAPGAGAGEVAVVVTNADGAYAIATHAFRYYR